MDKSPEVSLKILSRGVKHLALESACLGSNPDIATSWPHDLVA